MKRVGETIVIVGMLVSISGVFWLKNLLVTARWFGLCVLLTVFGCGVAALGGGLIKLARRRESREKGSSGQ